MTQRALRAAERARALRASREAAAVAGGAPRADSDCGSLGSLVAEGEAAFARAPSSKVAAMAAKFSGAAPMCLMHVTLGICSNHVGCSCSLLRRMAC